MRTTCDGADTGGQQSPSQRGDARLKKAHAPASGLLSSRALARTGIPHTRGSTFASWETASAVPRWVGGDRARPAESAGRG